MEALIQIYQVLLFQAWDNDVKNDLTKMKITKWSELAHDLLEWKKIVEKAKTLYEL